MLERLRVPFSAAQVKKNQDGLDYVAIDGYINRLLDTLGLRYNFIVTQSSVELLPEDMQTRSGKRQYLAQVTGQLSVFDGDTTVRSGVGADVSHDPDKAVKTAQAESFKKAAHQYGIALELWDEGHRKDLEAQRKLAKAPDSVLKKEVIRIAAERLGIDKPSAADVAEYFGVDPADLIERATLEQILRGEGLL